MRAPLPSSGLTDMWSPGWTLLSAVPSLKVASKRVCPDSDTAVDRGGENVWSPKLPVVYESDRRSACSPKPYPDAAGKSETAATATSNDGLDFDQPC